MALKPENPIVGGNVLRRQAIESPNYVPGVSGWTINQDGSAEFNNLTIRGTFNGTNFVINTNGAFFYSGTPALGTLAGSITNAAGTDSFGNTYLAGTTTYINVGGGVMDAVNISGITITFLISPTPGGTYVSQGILVGTSGGHVQAHGSFVDLFGTSQITLNAPSVLLDNTAVNQIPAPPPSLTTSFSSTYSGTVAAQLGANFTQLLAFFHSIGLT